MQLPGAVQVTERLSGNNYFGRNFSLIDVAGQVQPTFHWILRGHDANSWPTTRRGARGRATRRAGSRKSLTRGYGFMLFVPRTLCGRGIETPLMENQGVTSLKVSGTFFCLG